MVHGLQKARGVGITTERVAMETEEYTPQYTQALTNNSVRAVVKFNEGSSERKVTGHKLEKVSPVCCVLVIFKF